MRGVSNSVDLPADPEFAIDLFLEPRHLRAWWGVERCPVEPQGGGVYTLAWQVTPKGCGYVTSGVIREVGSGILRVGSVVYLSPTRPVLGPMSIDVTARATARGCCLTVVQDGSREGPDWDWYHDAVRTAWPLVLATLTEYVESETRSADGG